MAHALQLRRGGFSTSEPDQARLADLPSTPPFGGLGLEGFGWGLGPAAHLGEIHLGEMQRNADMDLLSPSAPISAKPAVFHALVERGHHRWSWFASVGALITLLGLAALLLVISATIASVFAIAIFMIVAGGAEIVMGFHAHNLCRFFLWIVGGLAYIAVGAFALAQPLIAATVFTLVLGVGMVAIGLIRIYVGSHLGPGARRPAVLAGLIAAAVGVVIVIGWPTNSFIILGFLLGLDLMFWGVSWIALGLRMRAHGEQAVQA